MIYKIFDEDGFLAIVNNETYEGFVHNNWEFEQLMSHFVRQMNKNNIIVFQSYEEGGHWNIEVLRKESKKLPYQIFRKTIEVTNGKLYLVNYSDLTIAAQFEDAKIPQINSHNLFIKIKNGKYLITVKQFFNPNKFNKMENIDKIHFEFVIEKPENNSDYLTSSKVFWNKHN